MHLTHGAEVEIMFIYKVLYIYSALKHIDKKQHHLTSLTSYHPATFKHRDCIRGHPIFLREIVTLI